VAENGREVNIEEEFPEVKVDFQVKYLINPYQNFKFLDFYHFHCSLCVFLISPFYIDILFFTCTWLIYSLWSVSNFWNTMVFLGDIFGSHKSNQSVPLFCIREQYSQCFSRWNSKVFCGCR
jgi:hypothetical protein